METLSPSKISSQTKLQMVTESGTTLIARSLLKINPVSQVYIGKKHTDILIICPNQGYKEFLNLVTTYAIQNPEFIHDYERVLFVAATKLLKSLGKDLPSIIDYHEEILGIKNIKNHLSFYFLPTDWKLREKEIQSEFPFIINDFMLENISKAILVGNKFSS